MDKICNMPTILIIDDEPVFLGDLAQMLEYEGFTVITALDGEGAIPKATEQAVDLILCDMLMQTMNGLTTGPVLVFFLAAIGYSSVPASGTKW